MPNKITYTITTADGKEHQVSKENVDKYGIQSYADAYKGATIRMRDAQKGDYDIPLQHFDNARKQGLHAFSLEHTAPAPAKQQPPQAAPPKSHTTSASQPTTGGKPMTAAEKAQAMNFAVGIQQGVQRSKQQFDTTIQRAKAQQKNPLNVQRVTLGVGGTKPTMTANKSVVQGESKLNAQTGKLEPTYITEAGNVYQGDRTLADAEQNQIDDAKDAELHPIDHELKEAYAERERLARELGRRGKELDAEALEPSWRDIPHGSGGAIHTFNSATSNGRLADNEWKALSAAKNQNQQRIVALEAERDKAEAGFWRGVTDIFKNPSFWSFGYTDMLDTSAMLNYGGKKTQRQKDADQAMIENTYKNQVAQSKYGSNRGFMYRAGGIAAQAVPFAIEFVATDGFSGLTQAGTKVGAKIAEKVATKALTKKLIKYTGTTLGDVAAGVVMANTTGAARTASDIGQRHLGHVEQDEHGNYRFAGGEDWGTAIRKGEIAQGLEYYTEKLGAHLEGLPIGKTIAKGLDKIGLSKVTAALNRAGTSQYAQLGTKVMNRAGVNGYLNEVAEEEANIVLNSMLVGDNKMSDLFDGRTQADIWGGMLFSAGAMEAAPKLAGAVDYYRTKKSVKDADTVATYRMTQEKWQPLRDQIDNATNEEMADVVNGIIQNPDLHEQEKKAALNYAGNLIKFRGFNTAQSAKAKELEENGAKDDETIIHQSMDNAYVQGHEASDAQKNDIKTRYEYAEQQLSEALGTEDVSGYTADDFLDNKESLNDKQKQAAIDYLNAKSAYNGMINQVKDNIDDAIKASDVSIDNHTHEDGNIYPATMKVDNRKVYVVGGHAQMNEDGTSIDHEKSSDSIMVRDAETGKTEMVAPSAILSVDEATNAEEEKANAAESIRQTYAQQEANKIDGILEFNVGDTYSVIGEDNSQHTLQVIGDAIDEKTGQPIPNMVMVSVDGSQQPTMLSKAQVQEMSDGDNMLRLSQSLKQREEAKAAEQQSSNTYSLNDEVTLTNEDGNPVRGSITADQNEDGKFEVYTEESINGKKVNLFSAEELDALNPDAQATEETPQVTNNDTEGAPVQSESEVNLPQNNVETPVSGTESVENSPQTENAQQQTTALERIPTDESGQPLYEQTEPETAWDAIVEQTEGDTSMAQTVADDMVSDLEAGVRKAEKTKTKSGGSIAEKIAAEKERAAVIEQAKATLAHWRKIAAVNRMREAAMHAEEQRKADEVARVRKEQEEKERVEQEEAERIKREALNGVPDFVEDKATDARARGRSENSDGTEANQGGTEGDTGRSGSGQSSGGSQEEVAAENSHLTKKEAADFIAQMELGADVAQEIPLTIENWDKEFGEDGIVPTPIGDVKMGENQFAKLMRAGRNGKLGMLKPTLEYPDAIVEENSKAKEGTHTERPSSFIFIKSFRKADGTRYYYFTSITVSVDGKEVVVSNQEKSRNRILRLLMEGSVIWRTPKDATTSSAEKQGLDYVHPDKAEGETKGSVITPQNTSSVGKDSKQSDTKQEKSEETAKKDAVSEDLFAKAERVAEEDKAKRTRKKEEAKVDTNPTEAQKEAGNYKKGHIKVDGFNVTIEQPKGSVRRGKDANGKEWKTEMHNTYGYIRGTESVDGDHIDIFLSDNPTEGNVFVVDQVNKDGSFDEHKVMYGFSDMESARKAYLSNYEEGWQGLGNITEVSKEEFKKWIDSSKRKTKPFAEYSTVKTQGDVQTKKPTETEDFARQDLKELEDFQKNTDTTGRTTIDVDRYEAEDLFAPLLLDGNTSRLGVLTVVPDKITDPSGQIAVYDYSDEIDEKTNSGWQKWRDLTDEYNKTVDSSDKAQERGDTATLGFTSVDAALKFYDWLNTGGHVYQEDANSNLSDIEYEDGNFSELTAEEPLVNVSSSIRSFIEGNLFSEVDFSDSPNKNVNPAISKLTDDELLKEIAKGDSKEWNFYMEEYDRRHNKEFQETVERYMNSLEDEKTSLDTAYGSYVNVAKNWSNGGYHTTERTLLRAQLDAIEDYVSRKESEQLSSVESEAYHQAKETVRKVGYDLTRLRLRPLEEGEACHVERRYTESNGFSFTGKEHVESIEDIAYIFKQLETSSVENSFLVLIKDGTPTVLHLSIGSYATTLAPIEQAIVAADAINPDKVLFVHNHPSGNISASKQDMDVQKKMKEIFGGKVMPAIIINTTSGKFGMFSEDGRLEDGNIPLPDEHNNIPINVYQFSQQVFAKDWNPEFAFKVVSPESIAEYVSSHRLGEHKKMSLIILDQAGHITGNVFLPWTKLTDVDSHKNIMQIISYVNQMGGRSAILYGNYELGEDTRDTNKSIFKIKTAFSNSGLHLMDVINIDDSAHERGAMEEDVEYGKRNLDEEKLIVEKAKADGTYMKAPNGKPTKLNERQWIQVRTQTFKSWFGDWEKAARIEKLRNSKPIKNSSKVVDENGEPMVVYHGTLTNGLRKFSTDFIGSRYSYDEKGFFFISNRRIANDYSISEFNASRRGEVIDAYVSLRNPLVVNSEWCKKNGLGSNVFKDNDVIEFWDNYQSLMIEESERNDGVIITDGETSMVVAFDPNQIKSATENNGNFSTLDDDIRYRSGFVNPNIDEEKLREGYGSYTNGELSFINDPVAKMLGENKRTEADQKAFAERERQRMMSRVSELADRLHLDNVEVVTNSNGLQGKKAKAKGFYSKSSGKITIVIPNHASVEDVEKTLLHEAVAHYGLRKLFGEHFETFLDNVYQNVEPEIRRIITSQAANNNWDFRTATEEYLAGLAERTDFERVHYAIWNKIKSLFLKMLHSIGFEGWSATELSDNELRYLLWRSYENMKEPGRYRSILGEAEDVAKQNELKVGNYDQQDTNSSNVAEGKTETEDALYRQGSNGQSAYDIYENAVKDSGTQTMLGALARTVFSKDARTRFKNKFAESYFDYSRSIKQLQDAIEDSLGVKLDSYEDVWRTLNAKGSADAQEVNLAMLRYIAPLAEHIGTMVKGKSLNGEALTLDDVEKYMNAVHGVERNKHMQESAFRDKLIKKLKSEGYSIDESEAIAEAELDNIRKGNGSMYMDIYDNARKDYSGLTALFGDEVEDVDNIDELEAAATQYANDFGKTVGMDKTLELWDKVRALNDFSLRKSYLSGLISKAQYEGVKQMYQYYVPLRGWHEGAAGDIYEYISRGERAGMLESALKTAKGRKSRAGDILGTMAAMVNTAIVQGNKNLVAQKFLNMALNYGEKSGLLMVGKQWYEESANEELIPLFPHLHDGMTLQEQQDEIERFEKDMEQKRKTGKVRELRRGFNKEVGLRMPKWQEQEHCVRVMRNGREHQVYVLGNPRAAQAFNGLLNKQAKSDILRDGWAAWMRAKATMQTSLSPEFVFSNFQRDILTAGTGTYIKFGRKAGVEFAKNLTMLNPMAGMSEGRAGGIFTLIHRYNKGTLDMSNEVERMFDEFVRNGGMTGVSIIEGKDEYQKSINKAVKRIKQGKLNMGRQAIHGLADAIEFMNSGVENSTRFAAYMVSRKTLGKSVTESVFDAKEASVNFNMKGSGAWLNLWMRRNILYANPAIQSVRMLGTWYEASPKRFMGVLSTIIATSVTMAMLWASVGAGDGDDDNDWYKLSEWNRYNYLNVWTGNGYAHWSLPQEFRPVWALGQIVFDWQRGMVSKERAINSMMTQLNNLSPMAFFSGGMDSKDSYWKTAIRAWTPTIAADFADAYVWNENFLGQKITNQEDYNIDSPEFQRAGKNTPHWAVSLSKQWNNGTGGAENRKSYWDSPAINPSALYYLAQQQLGGLGTMVTKLSKAYEQLEDPNGELEAKNIPFVSKVWVSTEDKQSKNRVTDDKFWMIYNDWKLIDSEMKHNKSDVEKGKMSLTDLAERMNELQQNGDHKRWARLRGYMKGYDELRKARNNGADVEEAMDELKKDVVKEEEKTLTNK